MPPLVALSRILQRNLVSMIGEHIFLPGVELDSLRLVSDHRDWLTEWLSVTGEAAEHGIVAASGCVQGVMSELVLEGRLLTDWHGIMEEYLQHNGRASAYSEEYGKRLYKFNAWQQSPVHAIHARWWIERVSGEQPSGVHVDRIWKLVQPSGWIYDPEVSPTRLRNRMRSELTMSMAMALEMLGASDTLAKDKSAFEATLSSEPRSQYISAEYFRLRALESLGSLPLAPTGLEAVLSTCEAGEGYCDFDVKGKVSDYMGTAHRVGRDLPVHSPLSSLHAYHISALCREEARSRATQRLMGFGSFLAKEPMGIPAFTIRDTKAPFGTDLSPIEVIAASWLVERFGDAH